MPVIERVWEWRFTASPESLWPFLADTARFNEAIGLPRYSVSETPQADGSVRRIGRATCYGMASVWEEGVPEWVAPRRFAHKRAFETGPLREIATELTLDPLTPDPLTLDPVALDPRANGAAAVGSLVRYRLRIETRLPGIATLLRLLFFRRFGGRLGDLFREAEEFALAGREQGLWAPAKPLPAVAQAKMAARAQTLAADGYNLAQRLVTHLGEASDTELERMRPRVLARHWGAPPLDTIETFLAAAREGLLVLRWDLICPRCRGAKSVSTSLDQLPREAHCPSCNISYERDFSRNVEVTFDPAPDIRSIEPGTFCIASPIAAEHIKVQRRLAPGSTAVIDADLPDGDYRARTVEPGGASDFQVVDGAMPEIVLGEGGPILGAVGAPGKLHASNTTGVSRTLVVEDRRWASDALTADHVTTLQAFRDLFSDAVLRPGDEVEIRRVALMFSDIKGSTDLYNRVGDAQAYAWVRAHFAVLARAVRQNNGAVVKTIGDAVMAAFSDPLDALAAAVAIRDDIIDFNRSLELPEGIGDTPIIVKLGLHCGPCIAVTLNNRLDYFGSTVNLTARLESQSHGGDIVMSEIMAAEPGVREELDRLMHAEETAAVKGFAHPIRLRRVAPLD